MRLPVPIPYGACAVILLLGFMSGSRAGEENVDRPDTVLAYQRDCGGWPKNYDRKRELSSAERETLKGERATSDATIDNGATYTEIRILAQAFARGGDQRFRKAAEAGIDYLLASQLPSGGWPQRFPEGRGYAKQITFNDNAMVGVLRLLKRIADGHRDFDFLSVQTRERCGKAVERGVSCILRCQVAVGGELTVWCAQHDRETFLPCRARSYELPSLSGSESVGIVRFLMELEDPSPGVVLAIESAVSWFEKSKLTGIRLEKRIDSKRANGFDHVVVKDMKAPPLWARFYDLKSNQPFFCGRDGVARRSLAEIPHERRTGYSWLGPYARELLAEDFPGWRQRNPGRR